MAQANHHYLKLQAGYLFPEIARRVSAFTERHPEADVIKLGIGDVTEPLPPAVVEAMHRAVDEMASRDTFRGYGPEQGYADLRDAIADNDYRGRGCDVSPDEVFVSDGSKCDTANILDILGPDNTVAVVDPVYPVYVDTNVMAGHTGPCGQGGEYEGLVYLPATAENGFTPDLPDRRVDVIYLCYPNNPTGAVATRETLIRWVEYAKHNESLILFDAAYEAFITDVDIPHSIYEVPGARDVAIEFRSFSKSAGFTGTRCAFTVVPKSITASLPRPAGGGGADRVDLHRLWSRRQSTKFNGVSYIVQQGALATYTQQGRQQTKGLVDFYLRNASIIRNSLSSLGLQVYGGVNAPYVWIKTPGGQSSWDFFDTLLHDAHVVGTPGSGFGASGEGYFRLSAFNRRQNVEQAMSRIQDRIQIGV